MLPFLTSVVSHSDTILAAILATQAAAQIVVNLTPTPADNAVIAKFYRFVEIVAGIWSVRAKQ